MSKGIGMYKRAVRLGKEAALRALMQSGQGQKVALDCSLDHHMSDKVELCVRTILASYRYIQAAWPHPRTCLPARRGLDTRLALYIHKINTDVLMLTRS